jgi:MYXO-CTERM domain-containing protein
VRYDGSGAPSFGAEPVRTWTGAAAERFGASVAALPDIDGDGAQELAIGVPGASTGRGHVEIHFSLPEVDTDGDGVLDDADCFPDDPALYPGAELLRDADDDGYGDPGDPAVLVCPWEVDGYVANDRDCDDTDPAVYDGARVYADADGDGHGDADALLTLVCPGENAPWSPDPTDCDDASATVNPDAAEVCNGADDDCDGANDDGVTLLRFTDADGDGVGAGASFETCDPRGTAEVDGDCDDASAAVNPQAEEIVADGIDNDCRGGDATVAWGRGGCGCSAPTAPLGAAHVLVAVGLVWVARRRRRWVQGAPAAARTGRGGA